MRLAENEIATFEALVELSPQRSGVGFEPQASET
jgi:hypothetical protein